MLRYLLISALGILPASLAQAWTITYWHSPSSSTGRYWSLDGDTPTTSLRYLQVPNLSTGPKIYFCLEHLAIANASAPAGPLNISVYTRQTPTSTTATKAFAGWSKIASSATSTFPNYSGNWTTGNYGIIEPQSPHSPRAYSTGHRIYGWFSGVVGTSPNYLSLDFTTIAGGSGNVGSVKITLSDANLYESQEPDVVARPVVSGIGDPSITAQGQADKLKITSPIPASYTLNWNTAGMASFTVLGGTGAGQITPPITSGTSRAVTNVPTSVQTYTLYTQSSADISWNMSFSASWDILMNGTVQASGTNNTPTLGVAASGTYILRVNGIEKLAEDEVVSVTPAFLQRKKTIEVTIGNP